MTAPLINSANYAYQISPLLKKLIPIIFIGLTINLLFSFVWHDADLLAVTANFSTPYFGLAVLLVILPWFANTLRLFIWTRFFGLQLSFIETFRIVVLSEFGAAVTPSAVGSGPVKIGLLINEKMPTGAALFIATLTTLEDIAFFAPAIPLALTMASAWQLPFLDIFHKKLAGNLGMLAAAILLISVVIFLSGEIWTRSQMSQERGSKKESPHWLFRWIAYGKKVMGEFKIAYRMISRRGKLRFIATTVLSGIQWICRYSIITALAASLGIDVNPILFFVLQWVVFTISVVTPTPGAIGGAEASFYLIFGPLLPSQSSGLITAGWRLLTFYLFLASGAAIYGTLRLLQLVKRKNVAAELVWAE